MNNLHIARPTKKRKLGDIVDLINFVNVDISMLLKQNVNKNTGSQIFRYMLFKFFSIVTQKLWEIMSIEIILIDIMLIDIMSIDIMSIVIISIVIMSIVIMSIELKTKHLI